MFNKLEARVLSEYKRSRAAPSTFCTLIKHYFSFIKHYKVSKFDVIWWIFGTKTEKGKLICNSPNDIISGNFDSEKVDQDGIFYYKDTLHFFLERPK
jgi:hypothetical protein